MNNSNQTTDAVFFTEMWERLSNYGMRALLVLFMVDTVQKGGIGMDDKIATAIYGLYTAAVYLMALPGGWLADRLSGAQRAVWYGGMIIALGHFTLALLITQTFYLGLIIVVIGSGIFKPIMSALVGEVSRGWLAAGRGLHDFFTWESISRAKDLNPVRRMARASG